MQLFFIVIINSFILKWLLENRPLKIGFPLNEILMYLTTLARRFIGR